jgi:hypothetical protein
MTDEDNAGLDLSSGAVSGLHFAFGNEGCQPVDEAVNAC